MLHNRSSHAIVKFPRVSDFERITDTSPRIEYKEWKNFNVGAYNSHIRRYHLIYLICGIINQNRVKYVRVAVIGRRLWWLRKFEVLFPTVKVMVFRDYEHLHSVTTDFLILVCDSNAQTEFDMSASILQEERQKQIAAYEYFKPNVMIAHFRMPYVECEVEFYDGLMFPQIFGNFSSTLTWLLVTRNQKKIYSSTDYENKLFFHNHIVRSAIFPAPEGECGCFDCSIIRKFARIYASCALSVPEYRDEKKFIDFIYAGELETEYTIVVDGKTYVTTLGRPDILVEFANMDEATKWRNRKRNGEEKDAETRTGESPRA